MFLGTTGWNLLAMGLGVCALGLVFGLVIYKQLQGMEVHKSMLEVSELIYATCKTYLFTQVQVHHDARGAHRRHHRRVLLLPPAPLVGEVGLIVLVLS